MPQEFLIEKIVRSKKPWLLGAVAMIMMGLAVQHATGSLYQYQTSDFYKDSSGKSWKEVKGQASQVSSKSGQAKSEDDGLKQKLGYVNALGEELVSASTARTQILRVLSAISQVIPKDPRSNDIQVAADNLPFIDREEIFIDGFTQTYEEALDTWFSAEKKAIFDEEMLKLNKAKGLVIANSAGTDTATADATGQTDAPKGSGWVIKLSGHHYVNSEDRESLALPTGQAFLRESLLPALLEKAVSLGGESFLLKDLGVVKPTIVFASAPVDTTVPGSKPDKSAVEAEDVESMSDEDRMKQMQKQYGGGGSSRSGMPGGGGGDAGVAEIEGGVPAKRTNFILELAWMPQSEEQIIARRDARIKAEEDAAAKAAEVEARANEAESNQ